MLQPYAENAHSLITQKKHLLVNKKKEGDIGMAECFPKKEEQGMSFQLPAIRIKVTCQRLMLHPYITASRTIVNILLS